MTEPRGFRTYQPEQLRVLQRAFDHACAARNLAPEDEARRSIATKLLDLFAAGVEDEARLVATAAHGEEDAPLHAAA